MSMSPTKSSRGKYIYEERAIKNGKVDKTTPFATSSSSSTALHPLLCRCLFVVIGLKNCYRSGISIINLSDQREGWNEGKGKSNKFFVVHFQVERIIIILSVMSGLSHSSGD